MNNTDENNRQPDDFVKEVEAVFLRVSEIIAIVLSGVGLCVFGYQLWAYSGSNTWQPISIISMLVYVDVEWEKSPGRFYLVHTFLDLIPLSLFFFILASVQYLSGVLFVKKIKHVLSVIGVNNSDV